MAARSELLSLVIAASARRHSRRVCAHSESSSCCLRPGICAPRKSRNAASVVAHADADADADAARLTARFAMAEQASSAHASSRTAAWATASASGVGVTDDGEGVGSAAAAAAAAVAAPTPTLTPTPLISASRAHRDAPLRAADLRVATPRRTHRTTLPFRRKPFAGAPPAPPPAPRAPPPPCRARSPATTFPSRERSSTCFRTLTTTAGRGRTRTLRRCTRLGG
mmetsp:Transcript_15508/g.27533  ORF Transcript_15508/g.27533 Transcript_15508/m.27533 type:complete len:225 (-) Transcript_15508:783-1457(-)